jgi:UDP-glucuronate 4-epimerase
MRVLITGVAGFIGSRLAHRLIQAGATVRGLDNLSDRYEPDHAERRLRDLVSSAQFGWDRIDIRDEAEVTRTVGAFQPNVVVHLAALASVRRSVSEPLPYIDVNVRGSLHVLEAARQAGVTHVVMASTGSVYGNAPVPFQESGPADRPMAAYGASKRGMELFAHSVHHLHGMPITILRLFNVYGPHGRPDMMPWQWAFAIAEERPIPLFEGGRLKRDWTYIDDTIDGIEAALNRPDGYQVMNLGLGQPVENLSFIRTLESLLGKRAMIEDVPTPASEPRITYADTRMARNRLGYCPKVETPEGLSRFVSWLRTEGLLRT